MNAFEAYLRRTIFSLFLTMLICSSASAVTPESNAITAPPTSHRYDEIGGDDILLQPDPDPWWTSIDIASSGDIYAALQVGDQYAGESRIEVHRSQDGGDTWQAWGVFDEPDAPQYLDPVLHIAEGVADYCFLTCTYQAWPYESSIVVARSPLMSASGDWTETIAMPLGSSYYDIPHLTSDAGNFDEYYLYLVATGNDGNGADIWFARSTDQGITWQTPYKIASVSLDDRGYWAPRVSYGFGGYVHVCWFFRHYEHEFDASVRYRRASSYAGSGISSWDTVKLLTSTSDGYEDMGPRIAASRGSEDVLIIYMRRSGEWPHWDAEDPGIQHSTDQGASFPNVAAIPCGMTNPCNLKQQPGTGNWILGGLDYGQAGLQRASSAAPTTWMPIELFADSFRNTTRIDASFAFDPSREHRMAAMWTLYDYNPDGGFLFDAEWRNDPGYPNYAEGFPLELSHTPISPPALVDLDGNGDLEIVYSDASRYLRAYHHTGQAVSGWPVSVGHDLADGPVAIGALDWSGALSVVAGTADGFVVAYDTEGNLLPGWPVDTGTGEPVYVSIGALGDRLPRTVVIVSGDYLTYLDKNGALPPDAIPRTTGDGIFRAPCAIGDLDGDEIGEVVAGAGYRVYAMKMCEAPLVFSRMLNSEVSDAVTLGDLDLDGDVEAIVPTEDGTLYALDDGGGNCSGTWPFVSSTGSDLTSGAIAQMVGGYEPEVAVAAEHWSVHLLRNSGVQQTGYPVETSGYWYIYGAPVIGVVEGSPDIMIGARDERVWSWSNIGESNGGWPKDLDAQINLSPAYGDLDRDGLAELVVLTTDQLVVLNLNQVLPAANRSWPMYAYDPQRSGCADCPEYFNPSDAPEGTEQVTHLDFKVPTLSSRQGTATFEFTLPHYAAVALEIFDVQGRQIRTVLRAELSAGEQMVAFDGHDRNGRRLSAGQYFARLRVRGGGSEENLVRRMVVVP